MSIVKKKTITFQKGKFSVESSEENTSVEQENTTANEEKTVYDDGVLKIKESGKRKTFTVTKP